MADSSHPRCNASSWPPPQMRRRGFSLTELLIASTISLVVMGAIAQLFSLFSRSLSQSQATVDVSGRLRATAWQLRQDLNGVTVDLVPWTSPESNSGYFELLEGPIRDTTFAIQNDQPTSNLTADIDDILLFTTRSASGPFTGRFGSASIEAPYAEVAWFCRKAADQPVAGTTLYNLHRRQLLVAGYVGVGDFRNENSAATSAIPDAQYDLSLRRDGLKFIPNTLGDLTKRENRFMRSGIFAFVTDAGVSVTVNSGAFPYTFPIDPTTRMAIPNATFDGTDRTWEDVILTNVIAFDVRVFDPRARHQTTATRSLIPGDPTYQPASANSAFGAYVDLGWGGGSPTAIGGTFPPLRLAPATGTSTAFESAGMLVTNSVNGTLPVATYDTWSQHYETNGMDEDGDSLVDEGTNGADDNADELPDNTPESETSPPYPVPLRGIEVRIRCFEPTSKQVRQVTVRHTFIRK